MPLNCGIVGLPNVGKSTLFNCLSDAKAQAANFPFCTIEPNVGTVIVPDERLNKLAELVHPQKVTPASIEIYDIAGLVKGASEGEGKGNQFLVNIRESDAIVHVLRCFVNDNVAHVDGSVDPVRDKEVIDTELQLKDLETVEQRLEKSKKRANSGEPEAKRQLVLLERYRKALEDGRSARTVETTKEEEEMTRDLHLLTNKPVLYVCNVEEGSVKAGNEQVERVRESIQGEGAELLVLAAAIEAEIAELETPEERQAFLEEVGLTEPGINKLIRSTYELLGLQTFFTAGEQEVRAWPIQKGITAPEAAGTIHTDFQRGFIKAEVISFEDYVAYGSEQACRDAGKMRLEGKDYVVQDGDVIHFKFNV